MKKTSIYIDHDVDVALTRRAAEEGTTKADLIRQALQAAAGNAVHVKPRAMGVFAAPAALGDIADWGPAEDWADWDDAPR